MENYKLRQWDVAHSRLAKMKTCVVRRVGAGALLVPLDSPKILTPPTRPSPISSNFVCGNRQVLTDVQKYCTAVAIWHSKTCK